MKILCTLPGIYVRPYNFCLFQFTPEGRRLVTGSYNGEFTLWSSLTFNFETILQAHQAAIRSLVWSHNDNYLMSGDNNGSIKYWQSNMNTLQNIEAHSGSVRGLTYENSFFIFIFILKHPFSWQVLAVRCQICVMRGQ